jgi:extracellular factor (EF) 3-hydroxypalmitic acid methyl ester biosynthesis protein
MSTERDRTSVLPDVLGRQSSPPTLKYEELPGGEGRGVFYRPDRISQYGLGTMRVALTVRRDGRDLPCGLHDLSQSGVALLWPDEEHEPAPGDALEELCLVFEGHEAYRGAVEVVGVRTGPSGRVVGVRLLDGMMDIDDVLTIRKVHELKAQGRLDFGAARRPWERSGFDRFKSLVSEMRLFLEDARERLGEIERDLPWRVVHGEADDGGRGSLIRSIRTDFVPEFERLSLEIDAACRVDRPDDHQALKSYSQRILDPLLLEAPLMHRARTKPLGYPGDFEVMRYIYEHTFEGATLYARSVHMAGALHPGSQCVATRKNMLRDELIALIASAPGDAPVRIASVAAGPAQETYEILQALRRLPRRVEFVLFEQDRRALQLAHGRLKPLAESMGAGLARVSFRHDTIKRMLEDQEMFAQEGPFDAVICAGLFDYLKKSKAVRLTSSLFRSLRPGGVLYVGNMTPDLSNRWIMEHHLDWYLEYRTRDELLEFAREGSPGAYVEVIEETQGFNPFAKITRA